jgi:uncharacterized membrane protein
MRINRDLAAVVVSALVCAAVVVAVPITAVRAVFAVPLCLVLPGYALTSAIFAHRRVGGPRDLMLVLALSLTELVIGSLALDAVPGGLRIGSWTALLVIVVVVPSAVALRRRDPATARRRWQLAVRLRARDVVLLVIAVVLAGGALALSRTPLKARNAIGYTQFWMIAGGTPRAPSVQIGVLNAQQHPTTYKVTLATGAGAPTVIDPALTLTPGTSREVTIPLAPSAPRVRTPVTARLYRTGSAAVYRQVTALISPGAGSS